MSDEPRLTEAERSILLERYDAMSADPRRAGVVSRFHDALIAYQDGIAGELRARRAAPQAGPCGTCRHWLPESRCENVRAQCNMGVSGSSAEKASHHPYPITRRDFGCTLWQPTERPSTGEEPR